MNASPPDVPKWFYTGMRSLSIDHAKLRMLCSPLNDHLFSHIHVIDNPSCACGYLRENNKHFLLECPLFNIERNIMFTSLRPLGFEPTMSNLLFGNKKYSENCNIEAFTIIQSFIKASGRFNV